MCLNTVLLTYRGNPFKIVLKILILLELGYLQTIFYSKGDNTNSFIF